MRTKHRRAAHAKHSTRVNPQANDELIHRLSEVNEDHVVRVIAKLNGWFKNLRNQGTDPADFDNLGRALNIGLVRANQIAMDAHQVMDRAADAMNASSARFDKHGRFGFTGPQIHDVQDAIDLYAQIMRLSTAGQMEDASDEYDRLAAKRFAFLRQEIEQMGATA